MEEFKAGEQVWVIVDEDENTVRDVEPAVVNDTTEPPVAVMVAPATVLEGGTTAQLTDGTEVELLPERTFHTIEEAETAAEQLAK
jgi:hypothetical protein